MRKQVKLLTRNFWVEVYFQYPNTAHRKPYIRFGKRLESKSNWPGGKRPYAIDYGPTHNV